MFKRLWKNTRLWRDTHGGLISSEACLVGAVLVIGVIVGLSAIQVAILTETEDVGRAVEKMDFTPKITPIPPKCDTAPSGDSPTTMADYLSED